MADHSVNAVLHRMSFHPFLLLTIRKPSFSSRRVRKRSSAQSRIQTSAPPRVVIRVSLKVSKFRASGRVKFIALGPPAPSWGRPKAIDALERAAGAETALTFDAVGALCEPRRAQPSELT